LKLTALKFWRRGNEVWTIQALRLHDACKEKESNVWPDKQHLHVKFIAQITSGLQIMKLKSAFRFVAKTTLDTRNTATSSTDRLDEETVIVKAAFNYQRP